MAPASKCIRIAILMADVPMDRTAAEYGNYGGVFKKLLLSAREEYLQESKQSGQEVDLKLDITSWDVCRAEEYPTWEEIDAVLITGSRANAFDNQPWIVKLVDFTRRLLTEQDRIRVVGVCFGHQIIGRALGVSVERNPIDWETSVVPMKLTSLGSKLFRVPPGREVSLHQMHRDIVSASPATLPPGVQNLGYTNVCQIQGMYLPKRFISVQGHPEFTEGIVAELLEKRREMGIFTEEMFKDGMGRVRNSHDGVRVAVGFLRFLSGEFDDTVQ